VRLIALLQARDEERFLPGWLENIESCVDGIVALDDGSTDATAGILSEHPKLLELLRNPPGQPWDEKANQIALVQAARRHGGDWCLCIDADERMELGFVEGARQLLDEAERDGVQVYRFDLRELWDPFHYRVDGVWGMKTLCRLFKNVPEHRRFDPRRVHRFWMPLELVAQLDDVSRHTGLNIYHLRMIRPEDRAARVARYEALDPEHLYQRIGYQYLVDETDLRLEAIPPERRYVPAP